VPQQLLHNVLGDIAVDEAGAERVTEAVAGDSDRDVGLVTQVDRALPAPQLGGERGHVVGLGPISVVNDAGEEPRRPVRPTTAVVILLCSYGIRRFGAERDELVGADLEVVEGQAGSAGAVVDDRVEHERAGVPDAKSRLHHQNDEMARRRRRQLGKAGIALELGHHELGHEAGKPVVAVGELLFVDDGGMGQLTQPVVAAARVEEHSQHRERQQLGVS